MAAITTHPCFDQPEDLEIGLWRYMDLSKFVSLLQRSALTFSRADNLGDPFGGTVSQLDAAAGERIIATRHSELGYDPYPTLSDDKIREIYSNLVSIRMKARVGHFVSCWHINEVESAAMWKLYSASSDSICLKTTYGKLRDVLPGDAYIGKIRYFDFDRALIWNGNLFEPLMAKRLSFQHEREVRVILIDNEYIGSQEGPEPPIIKQVPVDLNSLEAVIYINPDAPDWFRDIVVNLAQTYGLNCPVEHSAMSRDPFY